MEGDCQREEGLHLIWLEEKRRRRRRSIAGHLWGDFRVVPVFRAFTPVYGHPINPLDDSHPSTVVLIMHLVGPLASTNVQSRQPIHLWPDNRGEAAGVAAEAEDGAEGPGEGDEAGASGRSVFMRRI